MTVFRFTYGVTVGLVLTVLAVGAAPDESLITHVPGFDGSLPSSHYAGYVAIPGNPGKKNLFYYFIASARTL